MTERLRATTVTVSIDCPAERAYAFVANPENIPRWAPGLGRSVRRDGDRWIVDTPAGPLGFRFVPPNDFGVLDHYVTPAGGAEMLNPMRVVPNGAGSEVLFTVFQRAGMSDDDHEDDVGLVERDLQTLKRLLEADTAA